MKYPASRGWICSALVLALSITSVSAQTPQPAIRVATHYTIKADRVGEFLSATKDYAEALRKGGSERPFGLWASLSGPTEYVVVAHRTKWAELDVIREPKLKDMEPQLTALRSRINSTIESSQRVIEALEADLSLPMPSGDPQPLARVMRTWVKPEHVNAYMALVKSDVLPAAKKSGQKLFSVGRVRFGGSTYQFSTVTAFANWAEMDSPPALTAAMGGEAAYQKFLAKLRPLVTRNEYEMYRFMKDQSVMPAAK